MKKIKLNKKQSYAILMVIISSIALVSFTIIRQPYAELKQAEKSLENYLLNEFQIEEIQESGKGPSYDYYMHILIQSNIQIAAGLKSPGSNSESFDKNTDIYERTSIKTEKLFFQNCGGNPENCHPLNDIMPYCMLQFANNRAQGKEEYLIKEKMSRNNVFNSTIEHWKNKLAASEWKKEDLDMIKGIVISEALCGKMEKDKAYNWIDKIIRINIEETDLIEKLKLKNEKITLIFYLTKEHQERILPSENGQFSALCQTPLLNDVIESESVCAAYHYYRIKRFCGEDAELNYYPVKKYFKEKYSDPEKLICQIALLRLSRNII